MVSVLVIGAGSIGERHARCFLKTGRADVRICESLPERCREVADRCGIPGFTSLSDALRDPPSAAVIATPAQTHIPLALQLAAHGVHLLIEKPLSTSLDGLDELSRLVQERQCGCQVAYVYRSHPAMRAMREAIQSGCIGRPVQLVAVSGQHFPLYRPAYREIYYRDRATGGGAVQDALTHVMNAAEWLTSPVTDLVADADHLVLEGVEVEDTVHVLARHQGGLLASYSLNQHQPPNEMSLTITGDRGTARFEMQTCRWRLMTEPGGDWQDFPFGPLERDELFVAQAAAFLDFVENGAPGRCSLADAAQTLRVNLAILQSVTSRAWQSIG